MPPKRLQTPKGTITPPKTHWLPAPKPRIFRPPAGTKPVWLPNFTLTFLRPSKPEPPNFASFLVPLNMNKLDIKDYLYNVYGVPVLSVRSYIAQRPVQSLKRGPGRAVIRRWYRPRSTKKMTVEMGPREYGKGGKGGGLFVWPERLQREEELEAWDKKTWDETERIRKDQEKEQGQFAARYPAPGKKEIAEQARKLREGAEVWKPTWQALGLRK